MQNLKQKLLFQMNTILKRKNEIIVQKLSLPLRLGGLITAIIVK